MINFNNGDKHITQEGFEKIKENTDIDNTVGGGGNYSYVRHFDLERWTNAVDEYRVKMNKYNSRNWLVRFFLRLFGKKPVYPNINDFYYYTYEKNS